MDQEERAGTLCLLKELGGPREMAADIKAANEGDLTALAEAGPSCGLELGPAPGQPPLLRHPRRPWKNPHRRPPRQLRRRWRYGTSWL